MINEAQHQISLTSVVALVCSLEVNEVEKSCRAHGAGQHIRSSVKFCVVVSVVAEQRSTSDAGGGCLQDDSCQHFSVDERHLPVPTVQTRKLDVLRSKHT